MISSQARELPIWSMLANNSHKRTPDAAANYSFGIIRRSLAPSRYADRLKAEERTGFERENDTGKDILSVGEDILI